MERASGVTYSMVKHIVEDNRLHTICSSGNCPNIGECWNSGTATFMILGDICTRACKFCGTKTGKPLPPDDDEPMRLSVSVKKMKLKHCVITSVDRDDLPDNGATAWAKTIACVKKVNPSITIEALIPDFDGNTENIMKVVNASPEVISHNIETVERLTPLIRTKAQYKRSLDVLKFISSNNIIAKSGLMLGLGETETEVHKTIKDIYSTGCSVLTIGQYLKPDNDHMDVAEYIIPEKFEEYKILALAMGFSFVESGPLVRSSYHAEKHRIAQ
jgi:lipoyl synthase